MGDFLKSAMNYLNTNAIDSTNNDFVGQIVEVGSLKLRVKRVIAEGQYKNRLKSTMHFHDCFYCQNAFCLYLSKYIETMKTRQQQNSISSKCSVWKTVYRYCVFIAYFQGYRACQRKYKKEQCHDCF